MENILYIDDEQPNLDVFKIGFYDYFNVFTANTTKEAYEILYNNQIKVVITDQRMPDETGLEFINRINVDFPDIVFMILSGYADFEVAEKAISSGHVYRFLLKPWKSDELRIDIKNALEKYNFQKLNKDLLKNLEEQNKELKILKQRLEDENTYLKEEIKLTKNFENIISGDESFLSVLKQIEQVADSDASVLIYGETGTGKELVARAIHNLSSRRHSAFISVNCAAIPETLFESELFGYEKGAFTGAITQKKGKFELAQQGTIFLDELGEIPMFLQAKLLRVIQENMLERIGGTNSIKLDVRIISATNKNLLNEIKANNFRSDLYYRLNVFPLILPPLRERKNDIILLANHFLEKFKTKYNKKIKAISKKVHDQLTAYSWPGNIRELENLIERAVIVANSGKLSIENFLPDKSDQSGLEGLTLAEVEKRHILHTLEKTSWKIGGQNGAAKILGLNRTTLLARMKKLGISRGLTNAD